MAILDRRVWRYSVESIRIVDSLAHRLRWLDFLEMTYLDATTLRDLQIDCNPWDLGDAHDFFEVMTQDEFDSLHPEDPCEPPTEPYVAQSDPPSNVSDRVRCGRAVQDMFFDFHVYKASVEGSGIQWRKAPGSWIPRNRRRYEDIYSYCTVLPKVPFVVAVPFSTPSDKPHLVYHVHHGDDGVDDRISKSEIVIFLRTMKGRLSEAEYCTNVAPIMMLSIHSTKARIMTADYDQTRGSFHVKYSRFAQFDGFEDAASRVQAEGPRDLFFRWLNSKCIGNTHIAGSENGEEFVCRKVGGRHGRYKLVACGPERPGVEDRAGFETKIASPPRAQA